MRNKLDRTLFVLLVALLLVGCGTPTPTPATLPPPTVPAKPTTPVDAPKPAPSDNPTTVLKTTPAPPPTATPQSISILMDDFASNSYQRAKGDTINRLDGQHRPVFSTFDWASGLVTATLGAEMPWGGGQMSLNHPLAESLPINFAAILPRQILRPYQSQITGVVAQVVRGTPGNTFRLEIKNRGKWRWADEATLDGGEQVVNFPLPRLGNVDELLWILDGAPGDTIVLDSITFTATTRITDTATNAFVWSYGQLLHNWDARTGLVRDRGSDPSGKFDAIQATSSLAAATAQAAQLGVISQSNARQIVEKIGQALLAGMPRFHGLWPHFVTVSPEGAIAIAPGTEWSSVDTVIAARWIRSSPPSAC